MGIRGVYREVVRPERLVRTEVWEDWDAGESVDTTVLTERDGKTTLTSTMVFPSQEARDEVLRSGLERGAADNYDRLATALSSELARGQA